MQEQIIFGLHYNNNLYICIMESYPTYFLLNFGVEAVLFIQPHKVMIGLPEKDLISTLEFRYDYGDDNPRYEIENYLN